MLKVTTKYKNHTTMLSKHSHLKERFFLKSNDTIELTTVKIWSAKQKNTAKCIIKAFPLAQKQFKFKFRQFSSGADLAFLSTGAQTIFIYIFKCEGVRKFQLSEFGDYSNLLGGYTYIHYHS